MRAQQALQAQQVLQSLRSLESQFCSPADSAAALQEPSSDEPQHLSGGAFAHALQVGSKLEMPTATKPVNSLSRLITALLTMQLPSRSSSDKLQLSDGACAYAYPAGHYVPCCTHKLIPLVAV